MGTPFVWLLQTFSQVFINLEHFLTFCSHKMFIIYFALSLPQPWNQLFLQGVLIPFSGIWYLESNIWVYDVLIATRMSASRPFSRESQYMCYVFMH